MISAGMSATSLWTQTQGEKNLQWIAILRQLRRRHFPTGGCVFCVFCVYVVMFFFSFQNRDKRFGSCCVANPIEQERWEGNRGGGEGGSRGRVR